MTLVCIVLFSSFVAAAQSSLPQPERYALDTAIRQKNARGRTEALELFLKHYPDSTLKEFALESLIESYRDAGSPKQFGAIDELLGIDPYSLYGLTLKAKERCDTDAACETYQDAFVNRGLQTLAHATKPEYLSDDDFVRRKKQATIAFHGLAGKLALERQDFSSAQLHLREAVEADPSDLSCVYPLALAYMKADPPDMVQGLFYMARAIALSNGAAGQKELVGFGKTEYVKYHGTDIRMGRTSGASEECYHYPGRVLDQPR